MNIFLGRLINFLFGPYLYWFSLNRTDGMENYGDIIGPYLFEKIALKRPKNIEKFSPYKYRKHVKSYFSVGSVLSLVNKHSVVWGSGVIKQDAKVAKANFKAVRGPRTREVLLNQGCDCPEIYGDPAILLPLFYNPIVQKKYRIGIIPHYVDYDYVLEKFKENKEVKIINLITKNVEETTKEILECDYIISSSLHGIIVSHSYRVPVIWVKFSNKLSGDDVKFYDYFESLALDNVSCFKESKIDEVLITNDFSNFTLPVLSEIKKLQDGLLKSCPFKKMNK